jgi:hypothetical protein
MQALIDKVDDNRSGQLEYPEFVRVGRWIGLLALTNLAS